MGYKGPQDDLILIWDRMTGDMARSYSLSLRKDDEGKRGEYLKREYILL